MTAPLDTHRAIVAALPGWPTILRAPAPDDLLAPLLGPRVGRRMRRPLGCAMAATFAAGEEPAWRARPVLNKADLVAHRLGTRRQPMESDAALLGRALSAAHIRKTFAERDHPRLLERIR